MTIPGIGRINKKISSYAGNYNKARFQKFIYTKEFKTRVAEKLQSAMLVNLELVTFTNSKNFPDLLLCVLSFISTTGLPRRWTIYADDKFLPAQKDILNEFKFLVCKDWFTNISASDRNKYNSKWQFRKYLSFSTHPFTTTTIFLDSDVLFYKQFNKYKEYIKEANWYLPDPADAFSIDEEIIKREEYKLNMFIINSGFIVLNKMPPWDIGMQYMDDCLANNSVTHFSEQSAINIVYNNDKFSNTLDPRLFHVSTTDHFKLAVIKTDDLAIRHYVGPIRHKMWQGGWVQFI